MKIFNWRMKYLPSIKHLAFASTSLGSALIGGVFGLYYVDIYVNRFHVSETWFQYSQLVFLIWNSINDPLFGYFQDNFTFSCVKSRRHSILYGAPLFALAFLMTWIPWGDYSEPTWLAGFQLMFSLCFYDTLFTFVLLAHTALFTEISTDLKDRLQLIRLMRTASLLGSSSLFITNLMSDNSKNYGMFVLSCAILAFLALLCFVFTGKYAETDFDGKRHLKEDANDMEETGAIPWRGILSQYKEFCTEPSFLAFVMMNFCQIYHTTFLHNFMVIFCDSFISNDMMSSTVRSVFYGSAGTLPQLLLIFGTPVVGRVGHFDTIRYSFYLKISMGILLYIVGPSTWSLVFYFLIERTETSAVFGLFNLCLSELIDEDLKKYNRKSPISSTICGFNALITKPAISVAPMLTIAVLNHYDYQEYKAAVTADPSTDLAGAGEVLNAMLATACVTPILIGLLQLIVWRKYTIGRNRVEN